MLYDFQTEKWSELAQGFGSIVWSHDSKFVYLQLEQGTQPADLVRISVPGGKIERVLDLKDITLGGFWSDWISLLPDDSPLLMLERSRQEIYRLELQYRLIWICLLWTMRNYGVLVPGKTGKVRTPFSLELIRDLRCLCHVFAGHKQELTARSFCTTEPIGTVFIRFIKGHCGIFGHPLDDHKNPRNLPFAFEFFDFQGAGQIPAAPLLNKLGYVLDVCRHPTLISYVHFSHRVILHRLAP